MKLDPESLYVQLGHIAATIPADLGGAGPITHEMNQWLGRAAVLVEATGDAFDLAGFRVASDNLKTVLRDQNAQKIAAILHRALARAELAAPATVRGAFIPIGEVFSVFAAISKVIGHAQHDVFIVDPYADAKALTDFAVIAPEKTTVRLMSDAATVKPDLRPAAKKWVSQYVSIRPLLVRLAPERTLHDRLIVVDDAQVWSLTQSLKDFSARSPGSIVKVDPVTASLKIEAYKAIWQTATLVV
jgi:hypothetical protein